MHMHYSMVTTLCMRCIVSMLMLCAHMHTYVCAQRPVLRRTSSLCARICSMPYGVKLSVLVAMILAGCAQDVRSLLERFNLNADNAHEYACFKWLVQHCDQPILDLSLEQPRLVFVLERLSSGLFNAAKSDDLELLQALVGPTLFTTSFHTDSIAIDAISTVQQRVFMNACVSEVGLNMARWIIATTDASMLARNVSMSVSTSRPSSSVRHGNSRTVHKMSMRKEALCSHAHAM